jgi:hypothetical protein
MTASAVDAQGEAHRFAIVGEDEADAEHGKVSWGRRWRAPSSAAVPATSCNGGDRPARQS